MALSLAPLPRADRAWLHGVTSSYFIELAPDIGLRSARHLNIWWEDPTRNAYAICSDDRRVGFVLLRECEAGCRELCEFCVLPSARSTGIGTNALPLCLATAPGRWRVGVARALPGTARFWDRVLCATPGIKALARGPALTPYQSHSFTFTYQALA